MSNNKTVIIIYNYLFVFSTTYKCEHEYNPSSHFTIKNRQKNRLNASDNMIVDLSLRISKRIKKTRPQKISLK